MHTTETEWLTYSEAETEQAILKLEAQMGTPEQYRLTQLTEMIQVIKGQHETLADNGYWDIWCVESDDHCEVSNGKESLEEFAARCLQLGWSVQDLDRSQAICPACSNAPSTEIWASQYEDERGLLG